MRWKWAPNARADQIRPAELLRDAGGKINPNVDSMQTLDGLERKEGERNRTLREYVAYHLGAQDHGTRLAAIASHFGLLPQEIRHSVVESVAALVIAAREPEFWRTESVAFCGDIKRQLEKQMNRHNLVADDQILLHALQVSVMSLAHQVESNAALRRIAGIPSPIPWVSAISLVYPLLAYLNARSATGSSLVALAVGVTNLGYLLLAAGLYAGSFKVFKLNSRLPVLLTAIAAILIGVMMVNSGGPRQL